MALAGCGCGSADGDGAGSGVGRHTLIYGGDVFVARRLNYALQNPAAREDIFATDIAELLRGADVAMVNNEGVIAAGGAWYRPGQSSFTFRAHPVFLEVYKDAGIDLVTLGNNHSGDYGPTALVEMLDRFNEAGIDYTGAGYDTGDARAPAYRLVGDTVIAVVSAELTYSAKYRAGEGRAGSFVAQNALKSDENAAAALVKLKSRLAEAREHAHVVLFSPHWDGLERATTPRMRKLSQDLLEAGYDGILAHSHHRFLGVELFGGKPVVYDAGNLLIDSRKSNDESRGMVWEATFDQAGIRKLRGFPVHLGANTVARAKGKVLDRILEDLSRMCDELGTPYEIIDDVVHIEADPGEVDTPDDARAPRREVPAPGKIREAPRSVVLDELPPDATPLDVRWANGIRLVGYTLVAEAMRLPRSSQIVHLYFTTDRPVKENIVVQLQGDFVGRKGEKKSPQMNHLPGDWLLPADKWPPGKIIDDATLFRVPLDDGVKVTFSVALREIGEWTRGKIRGETMVPVESDRPLTKDSRLVLGTTPYSKKEKRSVAKVLAAFEKSRKVAVSAEQPY